MSKPKLIIKPLTVQKELQERGVVFVTARDFQRLFNISPAQTKYFLETYTREGLFRRLKHGLYQLMSTSVSQLEVANRLLRPSYVSFEYVLAMHSMIPESPYTITSATTKLPRTFITGELSYAYLKIKQVAYTGYQPRKELGRTVLVAEPEKALADYLYYVALGRKKLNERLIVRNINRGKLKVYTALYGRPALDKLITNL